jgi:hypothetical protein
MRYSATAADAPDGEFLIALSNGGVRYGDATDAISWAHTVCEFMDEGKSMTRATVVFQQARGWTLDDAGYFVGAQQPADQTAVLGPGLGTDVILVVAQQDCRLGTFDAVGQRRDQIGNTGRRVLLIAAVTALVAVHRCAAHRARDEQLPDDVS